eukprot:COSAG05_NODE_745_length_7575_cov_3.254013_3_plen_52_part_00
MDFQQAKFSMRADWNKACVESVVGAPRYGSMFPSTVALFVVAYYHTIILSY